ncbi:MAG: hypothetical protein U5K74_07545 [Gemmatimonadaceae bacterium]|nr:hypothetical protein [Gemmatimonadaceae bacterium]
MISPDLSRNDRSRLVASGGLTPDNIGVEFSGVVFAIAESPKKAGLIWAGTNDGKLHLTRDNGATWTDLTANLPGAPFWGTISNIEPRRATTRGRPTCRSMHISRTTAIRSSTRRPITGGRGG